VVNTQVHFSPNLKWAPYPTLRETVTVKIAVLIIREILLKSRHCETTLARRLKWVEKTHRQGPWTPSSGHCCSTISMMTGSRLPRRSWFTRHVLCSLNTAHSHITPSTAPPQPQPHWESVYHPVLPARRCASAGTRPVSVWVRLSQSEFCRNG